MEPLQQIYMEPKKIVVEDDLVVYHRCSGGATLTGPPPKTALFLEIRKPQKTTLIPYFYGSGVKL